MPSQSIKKVGRAALVKREPSPQLLPRQLAVSQLTEHTQLDGTQKGLGPPEAEAKLDDAIGPGPAREAGLIARR